MTEYILNRYNMLHDCDQQLFEWADIESSLKFKFCSVINLQSEKDTIEEQIEETLDEFQDDFNCYDYCQEICGVYLPIWRADINICFLEIFQEYTAEYGAKYITNDVVDNNDIYCAMVDRCMWFICQEALQRQRSNFIDVVLCERNEAGIVIARAYRAFKEKQRRQAVVETITNLAFPTDIERQILDWDSVALYYR